MMLKNAPHVTSRYWGAIMLASMCGANLGDYFPDVLEMDLCAEMLLLAGIFGVIMVADRFFPRGLEALYWLTILVVRAAATAIADYCTNIRKFEPELVGISLAALMVVAVLVEKSSENSEPSKPAISLHYWAAMLIAGTLGTVMGDDIARKFPPAEFGYPLSAALATLAVATMLAIRARLNWTFGASYWIAIVAVRWWGTNTGDISKYLTSLPVSMAVTAAGMAALLTFMPNQRNGEGRILSLRLFKRPRKL